MQGQISDLTAQPSAPLAPSVKLWTPGFIAAVTFLLGFPAGIVLSAINWMRMKMNDKAVYHLIAGAAGAIILIAILIFTPGTVGRLLALVINIGILLYLQRQMNKDINVFQAANRVETAGWPGGCLIGIGIAVLYFGFTFVLIILLVMLGVPIPE